MPHAPAVLVKSPPIAIGVVTNPTSKRNRARGAAAGDRRAQLQAILGERGLVCETPSLVDLGPAVERLLERGARFLVADGGDGTLHWLVNEVARAVGGDERRFPLFVPTLGGTINFVANKAGVRGSCDAILRALVEGERSGARLPLTRIDTLRLIGRRAAPPPPAEEPLEAGEALASAESGGADTIEQIGFCAALAGLGQRFFDVYYDDARPGPLTIVKVIARALGSLVWNAAGLRRLAPAGWGRYARDLTAPQQAHLRIDGDRIPGTSWRSVDVGAISVSFGGVVRMFPLAGEGRLHVLYGNPSLLGIALTVPRLVVGARLRHGLTERAAARLDLRADGPAPLRPVIDGERFPALSRLRVTTGPPILVPRIRATRRLLRG